jgi:disulfide bond formation protein DsbB
MTETSRERLLQGALAVAVVATFGSLYFSNIAGFPPCVLCWYQRIAMYPIVAILTIGLIIRDARAYLYALPLALGGLGIAVYHNLLYYKLLPESIQPCMMGVSCTTKYIEWIGFITIPLLALVAFVLITMALIAYAVSGRSVARSNHEQ